MVKNKRKYLKLSNFAYIKVKLKKRDTVRKRKRKIKKVIIELWGLVPRAFMHGAILEHLEDLRHKIFETFSMPSSLETLGPHDERSYLLEI